MIIEKKNAADLLPAEYNPRKDLKPGDLEYAEAQRNLDAHGREVDYIITHCGPNSVIDLHSGRLYGHDKMTDFLESILQTVKYKHWYMGHYHDTTDINKHTILYETIDRIK